MDIPTVLIWLCAILGIAWTIFLIVVMVAVLRFTREAIPYYRRRNREAIRAATAAHRAEAPWAYE